jgi:hypothetical protein
MTVSRTLSVLLTLVAVTACAPKAKVLVTAPADGWIALFNGRNLDGWTAKIAGSPVNDNYRDTFRVANGVLKVSYQQYDLFGERFGSLFYNKPFSHYWLRAQYRFVGDLAPGAPRWASRNSGIQLHSQAPQSMGNDQKFPVSVEFDIVGGRRFGSRPTGEVCHYGTRVLINGAPLQELCSTIGDITVRGDDWVTVLAEVDGDKHVRQVVNGALVVEYSNLTLDDGNVDARRLIAAGAGAALSSGYISIQSNGAPIEFKSIDVLPLAAP